MYGANQTSPRKARSRRKSNEASSRIYKYKSILGTQKPYVSVVGPSLIGHPSFQGEVEVADHWEEEEAAHFQVVGEGCLRLEVVEVGYQRTVARVH